MPGLDKVDVRRPQTPTTGPASPSPAPSATEAQKLDDLKQEAEAELKSGSPSESKWAGIHEKLASVAPDVRNAFLKELASSVEANRASVKPAAINAARKALGAGFDALLRKGGDKQKFEAQAPTSKLVEQAIPRTATSVTSETTAKTRAFIEQELHNGGTGKKPESDERKYAKSIGTALASEANARLDAHLEENHGVAKAVKDEVGPRVSDLVSKMATSIGKNPAAREGCKEAIKKVGSGAFSESAKLAGPHIGKAFSESAGCALMNPHAVKATLDFASKAGPTTAKHCTALGSKLGIAGKIAAEGAENVGKLTPVLGNAIAIGTAGISGASFVKSLSSGNLADISQKGLHYTTQLVAIAFPPVGLVGDALDGAISVGRHHHKKQAVKGEEAQAGLEEAAPFISDSARQLESALREAGMDGHANKVAEYAKAADDLQSAPPEQSAKKNIELKKKQDTAFTSMIEAARDGFQKAAGQTDDPVEKESLKNFEDAASQVWTAVQKGRVADKASSPEKRADLRSAASADLVVAMGTLSQADAGRAAAEAKVE